MTAEQPLVQFNATGRDLRHILTLLPTRRDWFALRSTCRQLWYQEADDVIAKRLFGNRSSAKSWLQVARFPNSPMHLQAIDYLYDGRSGGEVVQLNWRVWHAAARYDNRQLLGRLIEGFEMRRQQGLDDFSVESPMFDSFADVVSTAWSYCNYEAAELLLGVLNTSDDDQDVFFGQVVRGCLWQSVRNGNYSGAKKALHDFEAWLDDEDLEDAVQHAIRFNHASLAKRLYEPLRGKVYDPADYGDDRRRFPPPEAWLFHAFNRNDTDALEWLCDEFYGDQFDLGRLLSLAILTNFDLRALRFIINRYNPCINCDVLPMVLRDCQSPFRRSRGTLASAQAIFRYVCGLVKE